jgi:hypothetical protein
MNFIQLMIGAIILYTVYRAVKSMVKGIKERKELNSFFK